MKRSIAVLLALLFAFVSRAAPTALPPACPVPPAPPPALPPECNTAVYSGWSGAVGCLNALVRDHPDLFPGATLAWQTDSQNVPRTYSNGSAGTGFETNDPTRIANLASVTKPFTYTALVKLVQDHVNSPDCAPLPDGTTGPRCILPNGFDSRLNIALLRLDIRNGTDNHARWFTNKYIEAQAQSQQDTWKHEVRIRDIARMTSGWPTLLFMGYKFCDGPNCQTGNEIVCPTNATSGDCYYARLYHQYLENRGTGAAKIPDDFRPRPSTGPRLFPFDTYYFGQVYNADRIARDFWKRAVGEPGFYAEGILKENPATNVGTWVDSRRATASDVAKFYLGVPLQHMPGTEELYAQANLYFAAMLIEQLSGIPFNAYVKRELFTPLGMTDSFYLPNRDNPRYAIGGALHSVSHGSTDPNDHSNDEGGTAAQFARVLDIKRIPRDVPRVIPDVAPGVFPATATGPDLNWDEGRDGWQHAWPEGGMFSTATDMLKFLKFLRTGKTPGGRTLLTPQYLQLVTSDVSPVSGRTYAFTTPAGRPHVLAGNGYWGTYVQRDTSVCRNFTILIQAMIEPPHAFPSVQLCDRKYADLMYLREPLLQMMENIPSSCP
jgi:CubicO group peptidase (beta-lactamase class C family)